MAGGAQRRNLDPYEFYMKRREARLKLSAARIAAGYMLGLIFTVAGLPVAPLASLLAYAVFSFAIGHYLNVDSSLLSSAERQYVGFISGLAALALGVIMGSAIP